MVQHPSGEVITLNLNFPAISLQVSELEYQNILFIDLFREFKL